MQFRGLCSKQFFSSTIACLIVLGLNTQPAHSAPPLADAQESHPGLGMEARFAEAVIAYNRKQTKSALQILDELTMLAPKNVEYLELKALILKGMGDTNRSFDAYKKLYQITTDKERGPYAFEIGTLYDKGGKPELARPFFKKSIALKFNVDPSHLYLGLGYFKEKQFAEAEPHFRVASKSKVEDISILGHYYLGITLFKLSSGGDGIDSLLQVQELADKRGPDDLGKNLKASSQKMLEPFSKSQWFGNLVLMSQYDSNIQQLPSGSINPAAGSNPSTMRANLSGGGGYMSAPIDPIQWVAGYRASYNYNFNSDTKQFQYFTNSPTLFLNYKPLSSTSGGLRFEGHYTFQNTPDSTDPTLYEYLKFSFVYGGGAYLRHQLSRTLKMDLDLSYRKQTFYIDPNLSGTTIGGRVSFRQDLGAKWWNPTLSLVYENNKTQSNQFTYQSYGGGLMNAMSLPGSITLTQSLDYTYSLYSLSDPKRTDQNISARVAFARAMNSKWTLLADASYIQNTSTISDSFSYNRILTSLGVGYTF